MYYYYNNNNKYIVCYSLKVYTVVLNLTLKRKKKLNDRSKFNWERVAFFIVMLYMFACKNKEKKKNTRKEGKKLINYYGNKDFIYYVHYVKMDFISLVNCDG
jgi:hypothetical protein